MGIHYDYKSKRGERAMLKGSKEKRPSCFKKEQKEPLLILWKKKLKNLLKCMILVSQSLLMI